MTSVKRADRALWRMFAAIVVLVAVIVGGGIWVSTWIINTKTDAIVQCLTTWANNTSARTELLTRLSNARNKANDDLQRAWSSLILGVTANGGTRKTASVAQIATLRAASAAYLQASNVYNNAIKTNPVPPAPQLACGTGKATTTPHSFVVTVTPAPRTSTMTKTRSVPVPVPIPAPVQTRVVTKTVAPGHR